MSESSESAGGGDFEIARLSPSRDGDPGISNQDVPQEKHHKPHHQLSHEPAPVILAFESPEHEDREPLTIEDVPLIRDGLRGEEDSEAEDTLAIEVIVTVFPGDNKPAPEEADDDDGWGYPSDAVAAADDPSDNDNDNDDG